MVLAEYKSVKEKDGSAYGTIANALLSIESFFDGVVISNIHPRLSRDYIAKRQKEKRANDTIRRELGALRAAINFCIKEGWTIPSPSIILPPASPPRDRWLTKDEIKLLIAHTKEDHTRLFIMMAFTTGQRKQSILDLTWDRVDLKNKLIDFNPPERIQTKKWRGVVRINKLLDGMLRDACEKAQSDYVIEWGGERVGNIMKGFKRSVERAGLQGKVTPHVMRHTAAVHMAMAGVPLREIAGVLGHKSSRITEEVYLKYHPDFQKKAVKALEKL